MKKITAISFLFVSLFLFKTSEPALAQNGIDTLSTINSFAPVEEFYKMDYSGDYSQLLDDMDDLMTGTDNPFDDFKCSLFTALANPDYQTMGRNFDNPDNDVLLARYSIQYAVCRKRFACSKLQWTANRNL